MESSLFEIKQLLLDINKSLLKYDPGCKVLLGGSATTGRFTFIQDKTLILVSDLDLYVRPSNCLSEYAHIINNISYRVRTFEVSPSSKLSIRCSCTNCLKNGIESNLLYQHCMKFGEVLSEWLTDSNLADKYPKAYLPERLGAAYCLLKTISYYHVRSDLNTHSALYQIYKFAELYGDYKIEYTKVLWSRKIAFCELLESIHKSIEYFKLVVNSYLSTESHVYISSLLDCIFSSSVMKCGDGKNFEAVVHELCGTTLNSELEKKRILDTKNNHVNHLLPVHFS